MSDQYGGASAPAPRKVTVPDLVAMKRDQKRITMMTAYDAAFARLVDQAGIDVILVGDSLGMVVLGYPTTVPVTMDDMVRHAAAVSRGASRPLLVGDMPFGSYQAGPADALRNAARFLKEAGMDAVKLEGGHETVPLVRALVENGIAVMAHVGLTPQRVAQFGGFKTQAKSARAARRLIDDAKFAKRYADLGAQVVGALREFDREVREGSFPTADESFTMKESELLSLQRSMAQQKAG